MRNVAMFASQRSGADFNKYWPSTRKHETIVLSDEMKEQIMRIHKIKM